MTALFTPELLDDADTGAAAEVEIDGNRVGDNIISNDNLQSLTQIQTSCICINDRKNGSGGPVMLSSSTRIRSIGIVCDLIDFQRHQRC